MCKKTANENATTMSDLQCTDNATTTSRKLIQVFNTCHAHWGIDKAVVGGYHVKILNQTKLYLPKNGGKALQKGQTTIIQDKRIGEIVFGQIKKDGFEKHYCNISLIVRDNNVTTTNIDGLKERIKAAKKILSEDYGVELIETAPHLKYIEIAFTVAYLDPIPLRVARILTSFNAKQGRTINTITPQHKGSDRQANGWTISAKNLEAKTTKASFVFYDKSAEIKKHDHINLPSNLNIYRYEIRLHKIDEIYKSLLNESSQEWMAFKNRKKQYFDGIEVLSDGHILTFIRRHVDTLHEEYIQCFFKSYETVTRIINELESFNSQKPKPASIAKSILNNMIYSDQPYPFDIESILYSYAGQRNASRTAKDIIKSLSPSMDDTNSYHHNVLSRMDGWIVEDIINDMLQACHNGLGINTALRQNQIPPLYYPNDDVKAKYLDYLGNKTKPRLKVFQAFNKT